MGDEAAEVGGANHGTEGGIGYSTGLGGEGDLRIGNAIKGLKTKTME